MVVISDYRNASKLREGSEKDLQMWTYMFGAFPSQRETPSHDPSAGVLVRWRMAGVCGMFLLHTSGFIGDGHTEVAMINQHSCYLGLIGFNRA